MAGVGRWKKGESGNPGGRPKKSDQQRRFEERCRAFMDEKGWDILAKMAEGKDKQDRRFALEKMKGYGFGKEVAKQEIDFNDQSEYTTSDALSDLADAIGEQAGESPKGGKASNRAKKA